MYSNVKSRQLPLFTNSAYVIFSQCFVNLFSLSDQNLRRTSFNSIDGRSSKSLKTVWHEINKIDLAQKFIFKDKSNFVFERHLTT